jgi:hypothetical protein
MMELLLIILAVGILMYAVMLTGAKAKNTKRPRLDRDFVNHRWMEIMQTAGAGPSGLKNAISEADKLFDYVLKAQGYPGDTMAERLKRAQVKLSDREAVWRAHKLRNALAHEVGFDLVKTQAHEALRGFERGLKDLGAL